MCGQGHWGKAICPHQRKSLLHSLICLSRYGYCYRYWCLLFIGLISVTMWCANNPFVWYGGDCGDYVLDFNYTPGICVGGFLWGVQTFWLVQSVPGQHQSWLSSRTPSLWLCQCRNNTSACWGEWPGSVRERYMGRGGGDTDEQRGRKKRRRR